MLAKLWASRTLVVLGVIVVAVAFVIFAAVQFSAGTFRHRTDGVAVEFRAGTAHLRLANTEAARIQGLSGVKKMAADEGMLFDFQSDGKWGIWMKDMKIPLDIVWLDKAGKVVYIVREARPELGTSQTFAPTEPARYVIELNAGAAARYMITVGDTVYIQEEDKS